MNGPKRTSNVRMIACHCAALRLTACVKQRYTKRLRANRFTQVCSSSRKMTLARPVCCMLRVCRDSVLTKA